MPRLPPSRRPARSTVNLFAYAVPKPGYDKLIPAFQATDAGKGVQFQQSYGASGDQSRKVEAGAEADFVNFSVEPDITRLVDAGLVDASWNANEYKGIPFGSVVTIVVRKGNPKGIKDWDDLLQPGLEVVTPNPFSSGSAKWNLLAPYATKSNGGVDKDAGLAYIDSLVERPRQDPAEVGPRGHRGVPPGLGRRAAQLRERGAVHRGQRRPGRARHAAADLQDREPRRRASPRARAPRRPRPSTTTCSRRRPRSCGREAGFRPVDPTVAAKFADGLPGSPRSSGPSPTSAAGRRSTPRCSRRTSATSPRSTTRPPSRSHDDHHPTTRGSASRPRRRPAARAGAPPTRAGRRPRLAPGRALGVGVVGLWLSVIVLLPLAALTVALPRRGARPASGMP